MAKRKEEAKVWKSVRLSSDTIKLIEKKSKQSGEPFSETIRQAVTKGLKRCAKDKEK